MILTLLFIFQGKGPAVANAGEILGLRWHSCKIPFRGSSQSNSLGWCLILVIRAFTDVDWNTLLLTLICCFCRPGQVCVLIMQLISCSMQPQRPCLREEPTPMLLPMLVNSCNRLQKFQAFKSQMPVCTVHPLPISYLAARIVIQASCLGNMEQWIAFKPFSNVLFFNALWEVYNHLFEGPCLCSCLCLWCTICSPFGSPPSFKTYFDKQPCDLVSYLTTRKENRRLRLELLCS